MLLDMVVAQAEHREWVREFNARAARGDFVKHERPALERRSALAESLGGVVLSVRTLVARNWVGLLTRAGLTQ